MTDREPVVKSPVLPEPIRPERVAGGSIRGYLRQTIGIALEWLTLPENAVLVCEGDEDFDRFLLDAQGGIAEVKLAQTKDLAGSVSARNRSIVEVIGNFLIEFEHHTRAGRPSRFVFTTTATRAKQRLTSEGSLELGVDVLATWSSLGAAGSPEHDAAVAALRLDVTRILDAEAARLEKLDGTGPKQAAALREALTHADADPSRWATFLGAVRWEFGAPSLAQAISELEHRIAADPRTTHLPASLFAQRLTVEVLRASIPPDACARQLTHAMLEDLTRTTTELLTEWSNRHHGARLNAWAERLDALEDDVHAIKGELEQSRPAARVARMSERAREQLGRSAVLRIGGVSAHLERGVVERIATCARTGSLLVVGAPGVGKSAALHDAYLALVAAGVDVIILQASQLASEEALVLDALESWPGDQPAVLLLDALDAVRDGTQADALQRAITTLVAKHGRWNVVASVRAFDLDHHRDYRAAFASSGATPTSRRHPGVACIEVDVLAYSDLDVLGAKLPALASFLAAAPRDLATLLRVPFHLELACTLVDQGVRAEDLAHVTTRAQLLDEYWRRRIEHPGVQGAREALLFEMCKRMVDRRRMFASLHPPLPQAHELGPVLSSGVLVEPPLDEGTRDDRRVEFSHHVMFDYALARVWFPSEPDDLAALLALQPELVLFARPSLDLYFERLWHRDTGRARFWEAVLTLCASPSIPEVATIVGPGVCAQHAITLRDVAPLLAAAQAGTAHGLRALRHLELAMRGAPVTEPLEGAWDLVALEGARIPSLQTRDVARLMISTLILRGRGSDAAAGEAARLLFDAWQPDASARLLWMDAIRSVCATASTDPVAASARIRTVIEPGALAREGHETLHRIAREIEALLVAPDLVREIYVAAFSLAEAYSRANDQVSFGASTILSMSTSRRDAYGGGLYLLAQSYRAFVRASFTEATAALFAIVDGEVAAQASPGNVESGQVVAGGASVTIIDDYGKSLPGLDSELGQVVHSWLAEAQSPSVQSGVAAAVAKLLAQRGTVSASLWRVLCELGGNAPQLVSPLTDAFESPDTYRLLGVRHAATPWLRTFFDQLPNERREAIERAIVAANGGAEVLDARAGIDQTLAAIADHVVTPEARALVDRLRAKGPLPENRPLLRSAGGRAQPFTATDYLRERGVDPDAGPNHDLLAASRALPDATDVLASANALRVRIGETASTADVVIQNTAWQAIVTAIVPLAGASPAPATANTILDLALACMTALDPHVREEAVGVVGALAAVASVHADAVQQLTRLAQHESPAVRQRALIGIGNAAQVSPKPMWDTIETRVPVEDDARTQVILAIALLQEAVRLDPARALPHALALIAGAATDGGHRDEVAEALHLCIADHYISHGYAASATESVGGFGRDLGAARDHAIRAARRWLALPFAPADPQLTAGRARAIELLLAAAVSGIAVLARQASAEPTELQRAAARMKLCAAEIYFASGGASDDVPAPEGDRRGFLDLVEPVLRQLISSGLPAVVHDVIQTLERLLSADPVRCYLLLAEAVEAGRRYGYQVESMAVDLVLRVTTHLLAEHRALVQTDARLQGAILRVLDTFVRIGWTKAHALTFELASVWR